MDAETRQAVAAELESGEQLLWAGTPKQGLRLRLADVFLIPFSLVWGGFAIFWEFNVLRSGANAGFALFGVPFVLIGLYLIVGRFFVDSYQRSKTYYGLSDRNAIIVNGAFSKQVKIVPLRALTEVSLSERGDGSGTITLGKSDPVGAWAMGSSWPGGTALAAPMFEMIENARRVYNQIRDGQRTREPLNH